MAHTSAEELVNREVIMENPFLIDLKEKVIKQSKPVSDNYKLNDALKSAKEKGHHVNGECLNYCTVSDCEVNNIKNWLRYRLRFKLKCGMNECDIDDNVFNMYNIIFNENNSNSEIINGKKALSRSKE